MVYKRGVGKVCSVTTAAGLQIAKYACSRMHGERGREYVKKKSKNRKRKEEKEEKQAATYVVDGVHSTTPRKID